MTIKSIFSIFCIAAFSAGCSASERPLPKGNFIRGIGNEIALLNFERASIDVIHELPIGPGITDKIYQIGPKTVLFSFGFGIFTLDLVSLETEEWGRGYGPAYLPEHDKVIFFGKDETGESGIVLADRGLKNSRVIAESSRYDRPKKIVPISPHEVIFQKGFRDPSQREFWKFDVRSDSLMQLDLPTDCLLANVWRSKKNQVLCEKITADRFDSYTYFLDITTGEEERIKSDEYLNVGHYLPDQDALIIQKVRVTNGIEHSDLWLYSIADGEKHRLMKNVGFGIDAFTRLEAME